ncbi:hypothetical protein P879_02691 [Paragonimus westermani]|uniref:Uncharacterized protein n=1 Tax=Paragonimus westermani TaxID=34504 RepID=A0A8T0DXA0_9TREM|nr:hypothetical protein P879_02691 [Paragonimus westermani]
MSVCLCRKLKNKSVRCLRRKRRPALREKLVHLFQNRPKFSAHLRSMGEEEEAQLPRIQSDPQAYPMPGWRRSSTRTSKPYSLTSDGDSKILVVPSRRPSHQSWFKVRRQDVVSPTENKHKRPSRANPDMPMNAKRRSTLVDIGKENIAVESTRRRSFALSFRRGSSHGEAKHRQGLAELRNQFARSRKHNEDVNKKLSTGEHIERVIGLEQLSLSDEIEVLDVRESWLHRADRISVSVHTPVERRPKFYICESTCLLASMFYQPVSAYLEKDQCKRLPLSTISSQCTRLSNVERPKEKTVSTHTESYVVWLPHSPVDECKLDEFHLNHSRIFRYLYARDLQLTSHFNEQFLKQNGLTEEIRATLCDWMIKVQQYLKLRTETLHLAVSIADRYTWLRANMDPADYQLVGITALFVAAKFVERFAPATTTLCYLTENSYKPRQVLEFERHLLHTLDFEVSIPLPHHFLTRASIACSDLTIVERSKLELICCYLFELSLTELSAVGVAASLRCAAAVRLVRQLLRMQRLRTATSSPDLFISPDNASMMDDWPETLTRSIGYEDTTQLRAMCLVYLRALMRFRAGGASCAEKYEAAFHKFSNRGYQCIAQSPTVQSFLYEVVESSLCSVSTSGSTSQSS